MWLRRVGQKSEKDAVVYAEFTENQRRAAELVDEDGGMVFYRIHKSTYISKKTCIYIKTNMYIIIHINQHIFQGKLAYN